MLLREEIFLVLGVGVAKVVEHLPCKLEALNSNCSTAAQTERERERERERNCPKGNNNQVEFNYNIL
jgi:hypothetical protein